MVCALGYSCPSGREQITSFVTSFLSLLSFSNLSFYLHSLSVWIFNLPRLGKTANAHGTVPIDAIESGHGRRFDHHPAHAVVLFEPREVSRPEILPRSLRLHLRPPFFGQRRKHADHSIVFHSVGQAASLG